MTICCSSDPRRDAVRRFGGRNGLDFVEVSDDQRTLNVYFLGKLPPEFVPDGPGIERHLRIEGGIRVTDVRIVDVDVQVNEDDDVDDWLVVSLDRYGDHSRYVLRLVDVAGVDPMYAAVDFSFKVGCPSDLDCRPNNACVEELPEEPASHYLSKDYASFRRLIEDRLALISPEWTERHVPDLGVTLVELLACTGDYLSYHQDAVATEAYLDTARQRISVRRHARLVDYTLHEGCNARTWVTIETSQDLDLPASAITFLGGVDREAPLPTVLGPALSEAVDALAPIPFEPVTDSDDTVFRWRNAHNRIAFYDWGRNDCCLPRGTTRATLRDHWAGNGDARLLDLHPGDVLVFREMRGARSGIEADADPKRCWAVRLTCVTPTLDPLFLQGTSDDSDGGSAGDSNEARPTPLLDIEWHPADALPFPFCLSALGPAPDCARLRDISIAFGNVVLVDHGHRPDAENLGEVAVEFAEQECLCEGQTAALDMSPGRVSWSLKQVPLTHRQAAPTADTPASASLCQQPGEARPQLSLIEHGLGQDTSAGVCWTPVFDLLSSGSDDRHVVVEIDNEGVARLRFGDGEMGAHPAAGSNFIAHYRIGNGRDGNVGAHAINRLRLDHELDGIALQITNPMPAHGGTDAESLAEARMYAPSQFRKTLLRAITAADYAGIASRDARIQRAACELIWTGSWYEADVALDPLGTNAPPADLLADVAAELEKVRRMGHDLHIKPAVYVPIDLALDVCALPGYERGAIKAALLEHFGSGRGCGGTQGWFHPDRLSFGDDLRTSRIIAEAMSVPGVECVSVTRLRRLSEPPNHEIENGILPLAAHEITRLDNDPGRPEAGQLSIIVRGGR